MSGPYQPPILPKPTGLPLLAPKPSSILAQNLNGIGLDYESKRESNGTKMGQNHRADSPEDSLSRRTSSRKRAKVWRDVLSLLASHNPLSVHIMQQTWIRVGNNGCTTASDLVVLARGNAVQPWCVFCVWILVVPCRVWHIVITIVGYNFTHASSHLDSMTAFDICRKSENSHCIQSVRHSRRQPLHI